MNRSLRDQLLCSPNSTISFTINSSSFLRVGLPTVSQPQVCPQFFILLQLDLFPLPAHLFSLLSIISVMMMMPLLLCCSPKLFPKVLPLHRTFIFERCSITQNSTVSEVTPLSWTSQVFWASSWMNMPFKITVAHKDLAVFQSLSSSYTCTV